jgi:DNA-binding winged helix-turn-helix (wHTH) protein
VDPACGRISHDHKVIKLEPKVMDLLVYLASRPGQVVTREELEKNVWAGRMISYEALTSTVKKLRNAFADDARQPRIIETLSKKGYRLVSRVSFLNPALKEEQFLENAAPATRHRNLWIWATASAAFVIALATSIALLPWEPWKIPAEMIDPENTPLPVAVLPLTI